MLICWSSLLQVGAKLEKGTLQNPRAHRDTHIYIYINKRGWNLLAKLSIELKIGLLSGVHAGKSLCQRMRANVHRPIVPVHCSPVPFSGFHKKESEIRRNYSVDAIRLHVC